tara:strand:- start:207 stop:1367 length:1161 start_codon:yes stop_codon:yes gene_type:complete
MKFGQSTTNLMVFVILIALFMALYVLVLPPEERDVLLNQTFDDDLDDTGLGDVDSRNLLNERPGEVFPLTSNDQGHSINSVSLFFKEEPEYKVLSNGFSVSSSLFGSKEKELTFTVDELEDLDDLELTFISDMSGGDLVIELNGFTVFHDEALGEVDVILPLSRVEEENILVFKTAGIGAAFWEKNEYSLREVSLRKIFDRDNSEEDRFFVLSQDEFDSLQGAVLTYDVFCNSGDGTLSVYLNGDLISSELLVCEAENKRLELDSEFLFSRTNTLTFSLDRGDYLIDQIKVDTSLSKSAYKQYVFLLDGGEYESVLKEDFGVELDMGLLGGLKVADVLVNGFTVKLDTAGNRFNVDISEHVQEGENIIEIVPKREFEITTLKVDLV